LHKEGCCILFIIENTCCNLLPLTNCQSSQPGEESSGAFECQGYC
jgi:hypothetical protein